MFEAYPQLDRAMARMTDGSSMLMMIRKIRLHFVQTKSAPSLDGSERGLGVLLWGNG
jgi:hypothetical protein